MPMSTRRLMTSSDELVCSVVSTRCPVIAARMQICAVSASRTSPTMITSGSWRRNARSAVAKSMPTEWRTCTWFRPLKRYSTGSSTVEMLTVGALIRLRQVYKVVLLPEPVGPVTKMSPCGALAASKKSLACRSLKPSFCRLAGIAPFSRSRITIFSPYTVGTVLTRRSTRRSPYFMAIAPSCGTRFSAMSIFARIFKRETVGRNSARGGGVTSTSSPSMR